MGRQLGELDHVGAAAGGHESIVRLCHEWGATEVNYWAMMANAAGGGHEAIVDYAMTIGALMM
jgi:hypothetical protein